MKLERALCRCFCTVFGIDETQPIVSHESTSFQMVREEGVEPSSQGPKPCVLPLDDSRADGFLPRSMGTDPVLVTGSHACLSEYLGSKLAFFRIRTEGPFRWTTPECCGVRSPLVWLNGFEPLTPRSQTGCSVQTELQPGVATGRSRSSVPRGSRTPDGTDEESVALPTEQKTPDAGQRRSNSCAGPWAPVGRIERP